MGSGIYLVITLSILFVIAIAIKIKKNRSSINSVNKDAKVDEDFINFNEEYLKSNRNEATIPIVRTFSVEDKIIIRSMLDSEGILTFVQGEYVNNMLPGIGIQGYADSIINIYESDYELARKVIEEYIENLISTIEPERETDLVDVVSVVNIIPTKHNQYIPEIINKD